MRDSYENAQDALKDAEVFEQRGKRLAWYKGADILFYLWGGVWFLGFLSCHFIPRWLHGGKATGPLIWAVWAVLMAIAALITIMHDRRHSPVENPAGKRIGAFWFLLYFYVFIWFSLLTPFLKIQGPEQSLKFWNHFGVLMVSVSMFAYIVVGLWMKNYMLWVGLALTAIALLGLLLPPPMFFMYMAISGGGGLVCAGLFVRTRWAMS